MENAIISNIELFTGRTDEINRFRDFLTKIKTGSEEKRGGILSSERGMGKSLTLMKFQELAQIERFQTIYKTITPGTVESFFADLKSQIVALVPEKKKRFSKKADFDMLPLPKGTTTTSEVLSEYIDEFFRGLDDVQEKLESQKIWAMFLVDDTEFFAIRDFENAYHILIEILKELKEKKYNIIIIFSITDEFMKYIPSQNLESNLEMFSLGKMSSKEAEIFLKRVETKNEITISKDVKEKLIRAGRGVPFVLTLATSYLYENRENASIEENVWNKCKDAILNENIVDIFDLHDEELKILENIASRKENLDTLSELEATSDLKNDISTILNDLQEKQLLVVENTFVYFSSKFLFQTLKRTSERLNIFGRANILLDLFKESIGAGKRPDTPIKEKLDELTNIAFAQRETPILTEIAESYSTMGEALMEHEMFYEAFVLFSNATEIFEKIEDFERAALLCDEMAKRFSKAKKPYYARKFLANGSRLYDKIGSEWKRNALSRNAAMLYEEAGDVYAAESFDAFTRLFYRRAYSLYKTANEGARAKKVCQKARESINNELYRKEFDKLAKKIVIEPKKEN
ncbi:hypothetical protein [Candidatus Borrarchaeum sp.]|uniref:hypothetical protein n=1 Tax=Candidatus Borrarchaeum sp. TaxID=2846742 RepID=UPI00257E313E|nr:hypothetical protein [Candidatus Borrarchaeum sp.]